jgi:putative FmdB family regulatory protein
MPIYEYECRVCGTRFEVMQAVSDPHPICPGCASEDVRRLISLSSGQVEMDAREQFHSRILPEAKDIAARIRDGDEKAAVDIFGEGKMFEKGG